MTPDFDPGVKPACCPGLGPGERLADQGLHPRSVTIDGNPQLFTMLKVVWPTVIVQRCLVHIQRQGLAWCRRNPKRADARRLRELFLQVMEIHTPVERNSFPPAEALRRAGLAAWNNWERPPNFDPGQRIARSPETGWVFSDLKRARSMLQKALP